MAEKIRSLDELRAVRQASIDAPEIEHWRATRVELAALYRAGERDFRRVDLDGANLDGAGLRGADLDGAGLRGANLYGANLYGAGLRGADLTGANLTGAGLRGANLTGANLTGAGLRGANLDGATGILRVGPVGSRGDDCVLFVVHSDDETDKKFLMVKAGCFWGTLNEFAKAVRAAHGGNRHGKAYRAAISLAKAALLSKQDDDRAEPESIRRGEASS